MGADENSTPTLAQLLTATARLTLLTSKDDAWVTGHDAIALRADHDMLVGLLEKAHDAIEKPQFQAASPATGDVGAVHPSDVSERERSGSSKSDRIARVLRGRTGR